MKVTRFNIAAILDGEAMPADPAELDALAQQRMAALAALEEPVELPEEVALDGPPSV